MKVMVTTRTLEGNRLEFNIDNGLDQDLLRYCDGICQIAEGYNCDLLSQIGLPFLLLL
jgi:hypothetical protein